MNRVNQLKSFLMVISFLIIVPYVASAGSCFPLEKLPENLKSKAQKALLGLLDSHALYTVAGSLKPISAVDIEHLTGNRYPKYGDLNEVQLIINAWHCSTLKTELQRSEKYPEISEVVIYRTELVEEVIKKRSDIFERLGINTETPISGVLQTVNYTRGDLPRHEPYGYLVGYPEYAVKFHEYAGAHPEVGRDFINVPTYTSATGFFGWAVPKGHNDNEEDLKIKATAQKILEMYKVLRGQYVTATHIDASGLIQKILEKTEGNYRKL